MVHYPETPEALRELEKRVAAVHAEAVIHYIEKLPCPKEQKIKLINALKIQDATSTLSGRRTHPPEALSDSAGD
jgi:hypothetical protein